ncbi:MAG TPA: epimerase [Deltaproteobacteria bacterium]|nr:MAG: epimerase [Deltaproteobacteria bacterium GWA2_45_12]HBF12223.1 epimerase [Deltaproteobacteria bacterium]
MKILLTGAAGFIGSHLAEALLGKGHSIIGIDNLNNFYDPALKRKNLSEIEATAKKLKGKFECHQGDICNEDFIVPLIKKEKPDGIIHLAAMAGVRPSIEDPILYETVNGLGTTVLLEASRQAGIHHFIFGSSSSVYGLNTKVPFAESDPVNLPYSPYAQTKRANELQCHVYHKLYKMNFACLRFFTVYGPRQRPDLAIRKFTELMYEGKSIPILGDGSFRRDFTYVDDIIEGVMKSLDWITQNSSQPKYEIFNLGESATTSVLDLIHLLEKASGKKAKLDFKPVQPGDVPITYADISKARQILGYNPQIPLEAGIPRFIQWFKGI